MNTPTKVTTIPVERAITEVLIFLVSNHTVNTIINVKIISKNIET